MTYCCCICLDSIEECNIRFCCFECKSGYICLECIVFYDPCFSPNINDKKELLKILSCPVCRQVNWLYHYINIVFEIRNCISKK